MNCNEAQKLIQPYLTGHITDRQLDRFLDHVQQCAACREELGIYFIIDRTLRETDTDAADGNYDFRTRLDKNLERSRRRLRVRRTEWMLRLTAILTAELALLALLAYGVLRKDLFLHEGVSFFQRHPGLIYWRRTGNETESEIFMDGILTKETEGLPDEGMTEANLSVAEVAGDPMWADETDREENASETLSESLTEMTSETVSENASEAVGS